jgi:hypothetical protein
MPLNTPGDEMQDSADSIASGDRDDKQAIMKLKSTSRPPPPILLKTESQWRKFAYGDLRDIRHSNIKQLWASLRRDTTGLVKEWMPERYVWEDLSEESRKQISSWASNAKEHIENEQKDHPKALFEGWIFHLLHENLFSLDCHEKWSSPDWAMFGQLQRIFSSACISRFPLFITPRRSCLLTGRRSRRELWRRWFAIQHSLSQLAPYLIRHALRHA